MNKKPINNKEQKRLFIEEAGGVAQSFKEFEQTHYCEGKDIVWSRIQDTIKKEQNKKRQIVFYIVSAAATVLLLLGIAIPYVYKSMTNEVGLNLAHVSVPEMPVNEILLVTSSNQKLNVADNSDVVYKKDGSVSVNSHTAGKVASEGAPTDKGKFNQIIVPKGKRTNINFADGTRIYVNAGTRVVYPVVFSAHKREIYVDGEIYLEVKHEESRPFIVKTGNLDVRVLGTSFNVCAYKGDTETSVVLVSGRVEVETKSKQKVLLSPNDMLEMNATEVSKRKVDVSNYISWKEGFMKLQYEPLDRVLTKLSRYYGQEILFDKSLASMPISGKLDLRDKLEDVVGIIAETAPVTVVKDYGTIYVKSKK